MNNNGFAKVALKDDISVSRPKRINTGGREIVLFRSGEEIFAIENLCPHQLFSVFHQAKLDGYTLTCPMHGWSFDIRNGKNIAGSGRIKTYDIQLDGNDVWLKIPEE